MKQSLAPRRLAHLDCPDMNNIIERSNMNLLHALLRHIFRKITQTADYEMRENVLSNGNRKIVVHCYQLPLIP